jgi:hypothetical protein
VTRLGDFSPIGRLFIWGSFVILNRLVRSQKNCATFFLRKNNALILEKMGWATFWSIFSLTYLVTLVNDPKCLSSSLALVPITILLPTTLLTV